MKPNRPIILILSSDPAFAHAVTEAWPRDSETPEFTLLEQDLWRELRPDSYQLAIADDSRHEEHDALTEALSSVGKPAILVHSGSFLSRNASRGPILLLRREPDSWPQVVGLLGREILRRTHAEGRALDAEKARALAEDQAMLGRYMVEMRHSVNNALTSVLGNAELLLLEAGLPASVHGQADTIRNMALRVHEVFQRFSSLEKELNVVARESGKSAASATAPLQPERASSAFA